jgi:hypothetical protein
MPARPCGRSAVLHAGRGPVHHRAGIRDRLDFEQCAAESNACPDVAGAASSRHEHVGAPAGGVHGIEPQGFHRLVPIVFEDDGDVPHAPERVVVADAVPGDEIELLAALHRAASHWANPELEDRMFGEGRFAGLHAAG